jgi:hypothetical protein
VKALLLLLAACQSSDVSRSLGAECTSNHDCDDVCATGPEWPDGMCTQSCMTDKDCPAEAACTPDLGGVCAFRCTSDAGCTFLGTGYGCATNATMEAVCIGR